MINADWYIKQMRLAESFTEAKNYASAAGYCVGQLIRDRFMECEK